MNIDIIPCLNDNYSYLIKDDQTNTVAIIDPSEFGTCDKKIDIKYKYLLILAFSLAMLINSFLYYFLNCFILLFFLYFLVLNKSSLFFLKNNLKKITF